MPSISLFKNGNSDFNSSLLRARIEKVYREWAIKSLFSCAVKRERKTLSRFSQ